ncbi:MAG: 4Fe-4S dicluster domain-containing protein [Bacillota bacterium]|nr:4Fe-4S dicluster domain-containing protein [Bacillota bacterium]
MKAIKKSQMNDLIQALSVAGQVFVPQEINGSTKFAPWHKDAKVQLDKNTLLSPKDTLFPQTETMYNYVADNLNTSIEEAAATTERQIIVGIRPCDVKSVRLMDLVFLTKGFEDKFYKNKRDNTLLVSVGCDHAEPSCFCTSMGVNPQEEEGADLALVDLGDEYGVEAKTEAGKELLGQIKSLLADSSKEPVKTSGFQIEFEGVDQLPAKLKDMFEHPLWDEICLKCIGCGACTYLCPTCHCFDIQTKKVGKDGTNYRCWDSCMFGDYALMAGGHDPRPSKKERVRQRFMHKLRYFPERYNELMCVGCGRCLAKCPVNVDITRIIGRIKEADVNVG